MTPEACILDAVLDYLAAERVVAFRCNTGAIKVDDRFIRFGVKGFADILALPEVSGAHRCGIRVRWTAPCFIEVKAPKGRQSAEQRSFERQVKDAGAEYVVVRSVDEMRDFLRQHGVIK
jgi:hypothetical protein